jgi:2-polyprenyl-3-methyl-5-hydroxy-6-metoxy-1,4-benzoquinol methylase
MNVIELENLVDPYTEDKLVLQDGVYSNDKLVEGYLVNTKGTKYKILHGIPSFVTHESQSTESVESFEYEWNTFGFDYGKESWLEDIVDPLLGGITHFNDKVIVDAGAGSGCQSRWMAEAGAKKVYSLELSNSIFERLYATV